MSKKLVLPVEVKKIATQADFSIRLSLETAELPPNEVATLVAFSRAGQIWAVLVENNPSIKEIEETNIPKDFAVNPLKKSQSQRVRAIIYRLWEQSDRSIPSEAYYNRRMERIFNSLQEELEETP